MFSLQQFEEAEERVHEWHAEIHRCIDEQHAQATHERRSWFAALAHCLGYVGRGHVRSHDRVDESALGNHATVR